MQARFDNLTQLAGEPRLLISRHALLHNASVIRNAVGPTVRLCAMVKADAYGHGAAIVADTLSNVSLPERELSAPAVDALAVATIDEAESISPSRSALPVVVFQPIENAFIGIHRAQIELAITRGWTLTLCSKSAADDVARIAAAVGAAKTGAGRHMRANVQVMIDTGMARSGAEAPRAKELIDRVAQWPALRLVGICTHFACAESAGDTFTRRQLQQFDSVTADYAGKVVRHACNSAATFFTPEAHLDMVRPGIAIYGIDPTGRPNIDRKLRPVMTWLAPLVGVRDIPTGTPVGYDQTWRSTRPTRLGLVPIGYGDGYLRAFSNRAVMMVNGRPAPVVGRVSMDATTIDLTDIPNANIGDDVTILDADPLSPASVYALAKIADTIPYELFTRIGPRVKRVAVEPADHELPVADASPLDQITEFDW